jgi:hypothetical protein
MYGSLMSRGWIIPLILIGMVVGSVLTVLAILVNQGLQDTPIT